MTDTADRVIKTRLVEIDPRDIKLLDENASSPAWSRTSSGTGCSRPLR
jgi:hypothetical protein